MYFIYGVLCVRCVSVQGTMQREVVHAGSRKRKNDSHTPEKRERDKEKEKISGLRKKREVRKTKGEEAKTTAKR